MPKSPFNNPYTYQKYRRRKSLFISLYSSFLGTTDGRDKLEAKIEDLEDANTPPEEIYQFLYDILGDVIFED